MRGAAAKAARAHFHGAVRGTLYRSACRPTPQHHHLFTLVGHHHHDHRLAKSQAGAGPGRGLPRGGHEQWIAPAVIARQTSEKAAAESLRSRAGTPSTRFALSSTCAALASTIAVSCPAHTADWTRASVASAKRPSWRNAVRKMNPPCDKVVSDRGRQDPSSGPRVNAGACVSGNRRDWSPPPKCNRTRHINATPSATPPVGVQTPPRPDPSCLLLRRL